MKATITLGTDKKNMTAAELKAELKKQGVVTTMLYVDGKPVMPVGYTSESDKKALIKTVELACDNSNSLVEAMSKLMTACSMSEAPAPKPDETETVLITGRHVILNYTKGIATLNGKVVADLNGKLKVATKTKKKEALVTIAEYVISNL